MLLPPPPPPHLSSFAWPIILDLGVPSFILYAVFTWADHTTQGDHDPRPGAPHAANTCIYG